MSKLSKALGLDKHKDVLDQVNKLFDVFVNLFKPKMKDAFYKAAANLGLTTSDADAMWAEIEADL